MRIKKFYGRSFNEALQLIKREFGPDAVILSSEEIEDGRVQVVGAIDEDLTNEAVRKRETPSEGGIQNLLIREIERLREALDQMRKTGFEMRLPPRRRKLLSLLLKNAVREEFALRLCEKADDVESLISSIAREIRIKQPGERQKAILLMGPTGVGKTTTLSKLAAQEIRRGKTTAIITLDTQRIGAVEQLRRFSQLLGIPFEAVHRVDDLKVVYERFSNKDRIFIDTSGRNPRKAGHVEALRRVVNSGIPLEVHLIVSASSDDAFLSECYTRYRDVPIDCIGFTKLDESVRRGVMYNQILLYQKPVAYLTNGQRIPGDIIFPDSKTLAMMVLGAEDTDTVDLSLRNEKHGNSHLRGMI